jgi:hypothetical protein
MAGLANWGHYSRHAGNEASRAAQYDAKAESDRNAGVVVFNLGIEEDPDRWSLHQSVMHELRNVQILIDASAFQKFDLQRFASRLISNRRDIGRANGFPNLDRR